jgi:hypothetical protein
MAFGITAIVAGVVTAGATIYNGIVESNNAKKAAAIQQQGAEDAAAKFNPYAESGAAAVSGQGDLAGLNGADKQQAAIAGIQASPEFAAMLKQGEDAILSNASATGGLRGGNTQGALAQFRPQLLSQLINQQYQRLGGLAGQGLQAAGGQAGLMQDAAAAAAGAAQAPTVGQNIANGLSAGLGAGLAVAPRPVAPAK